MLVLQRTDGGIISRLSHPVNTAMLRPRQALGGLPWAGCPLPFLGLRRDGRSIWGPAFVPLVTKLVSACVPKSASW